MKTEVGSIIHECVNGTKKSRAHVSRVWRVVIQMLPNGRIKTATFFFGKQKTVRSWILYIP